MTTNILLRLFAATAVAATFACTPRGPSAPSPDAGPPRSPPSPEAGPPRSPPVVLRAPVPPANPALPAVPTVTGPLAIRVVYPPAGHLIQSRDSNFVFGSVGNGLAGLTVNGVPTPVWPNGAFVAWLANPSPENPRYDIVATTGFDTVRLAQPVKIAPAVTAPLTPLPPDTILPMSPARYATLIGPAVYPSDTDRVVTGYAPGGGAQRWFLFPGTIVKVTGTKGPDAYIDLDGREKIRIARSDLDTLPLAYRPVPLRAGVFRTAVAEEWTDLNIPVTDRPAYLVRQTDSSLTLTLYGVAGPRTTPVSVNPGGNSYVTSARSMAVGALMQYSLALRGPVFGYLPLWENGVFTFRVRRPPAVDSAAPLRGLTITVDPGHPPIGATGPTGLWEPEATLPIGLRMQALLVAQGANVIMTRTTPEAVALNDRPALARRAGSHALVSIHLNAVPDGVNPLRVDGTATYHFHPHSQALARTTQRGLVRELALRDNGVKRENFAVVRLTWMPSVLAEGAFIIVPEQEAALRTAEYQERYAKGLVTGLEDYFRTLAGARR
ncbi:MAG: N-acetylmuramoyl-L-alanine amidase [Gemmatimonadaceae bacterium]